MSFHAGLKRGEGLHFSQPLLNTFVRGLQNQGNPGGGGREASPSDSYEGSPPPPAECSFASQGRSLRRGARVRTTPSFLPAGLPAELTHLYSSSLARRVAGTAVLCFFSAPAEAEGPWRAEERLGRTCKGSTER